MMKRNAVVFVMIAILATLALSGCMPMGTPSAGDPGATPQDSTSGLMGFLPLILIIVVFYFILIRPQNKKNKQVQQMRDAVKRGDWVTTIGGFRGRIVRIKEDVITIEIGSDKTKLDIMKWGISKIDETGPDTKSTKKSRDEDAAEEADTETEKPKRKPKKLDAPKKEEAEEVEAVEPTDEVEETESKDDEE